MIQLLFFTLANLAGLITFYNKGQTNLLLFFGISASILLFFTVLIRKLQKKGKKSAPELMARTLTFWWILSIFSIAMIFHPLLIFLILVLTSILGMMEYLLLLNGSTKVMDSVKTPLFFFAAVGILLSYALLYLNYQSYFFMFNMTYALILIPSFVVLTYKRNLADVVTAFQFFAFLLPLAWPLFKAEVNAFLLTIFLTELRDLVSYWLGKFSSRINPSVKFVHAKIAADVSPNKTWFTGLLTVLVIYLIGYFLIKTVFPLRIFTEFSTTLMLLQIGLFGLFGDLIFSLIKRSSGHKDSGTWMPGGTGLLDRIDALIFTLPLSYFCMLLS